MQTFNKPNSENDYLARHAMLLIFSYHHWTGKNLLRQQSDQNSYRALYNAPYAIVSHNTDDDPVFNYANRTALSVFEMDWPEFTSLPSRKSAEPVVLAERERLMARVSKYGFIDDYRGVRISSTGKHFMIEDATVWNIVDARGKYYGQAAVFYKWSAIYYNKLQN
ncbi:MAG: MEKHLA domain-containing protein [Gammaproteobacteria bacterium]|nr:MAG: MEKHLA domain-containing protein [Gammaproteobacteria bacterium]